VNRIVRELRSIPGLVLGFLFAAIVTLWVVNLIQTRAPAPISSAAGWAFGRATGQAYQPAAPVVVTSPYSANANTYM
jgi:hypothetical protein